MLNHAFWVNFLTPEFDEELRRSAMGFMRSWFHLVQTLSDYDVAVEKGLLRLDPAAYPNGYETFVKLITPPVSMTK